MLIIFQYAKPSISYLRVYFYVNWPTFSKMPRACIVFNLIPVFFGQNVRILHVTTSILENPVRTRYRVNLWMNRIFYGRCLLLEEQYWWKMTIDGRQPLIEDSHLWTRNFDERWKMEDEIWWKTTFYGRWLLMEDGLWRRSCKGKWILMEDDLWWKTTFDGLQPSMEEVIKWKTILDGRWPSMQDNLEGQRCWS